MQLGSGQGEYAGSKTLTLTLTLTGCERTSDHEPCQSIAGASGQVVTNALEGELGFITTGKTISVGLDLKHEPLASFECTTAALPGKELVSVEGSVIGSIKKLDEMVSSFTVTYKQSAGKQAPEQFEGAAPDILMTSIVGGASKEQTGLSATMTITNEEKLEIKAKTRGGK